MNSVLLSSQYMNWCTPRDFFEKLNAEFHFTLDAAATDATALCPDYFTPETDGLARSWATSGAVWCNPPYGREIGKWVKKAHTEALRGGSLFCLSRPGRTPATSTTTYTIRRRSGLYAGGCASRTRPAPRAARPHSRPCLWSTTRRQNDPGALCLFFSLFGPLYLSQYGFVNSRFFDPRFFAEYNR